MVELWVLSFNETYMAVPFAFIIIIIFEYISWLLVLLQNALQTPSPNMGFTGRLYSVHTARPQRANGALEDTTALPQRPHSALSYTLTVQTPSCGVCFEHDKKRMAF